MEMGTLPDPRQVGFDALYAEAKKALSHSANELRALTESLREAYADALGHWQREHDGALPTTESAGMTAELARGKQMLARLEVAARELESSWLFLERGQQDPAIDATARPGPENPVPVDPTGISMRILEAQESERLRLADELHDGPAQALANAAFQVEVISKSLRHDPATAQEEVRALRARLDRELEDMRGFISQLRPSVLEEEGLDAALQEAADRMSAETEVPVRVELAAPPSLLDPPHRMAVLRVAQEALRNVGKHADARSALLATRLVSTSGPEAGRAWILEVHDDGKGFGVEEALARGGRRHFGLRFMRERAQLIGARLEIVSAPERGTTVRLTLDGG